MTIQHNVAKWSQNAIAGVVICALHAYATPALAQGNARGGANDSVTASTALSVAMVGSVVGVPMLALSAGSVLIVSCIVIVGETAEVTVKAAGHAVGYASEQVLKLGANTVRGLSLAVGHAIEVTATAGAMLLYTGGALLCYVPVAASTSFLQSSRSTHARPYAKGY